MINSTAKVAILLLLLSLTPKVFSHEEKETIPFNPNFAHTVYIWLKNPDSISDRSKFETSLKKFLNNSTVAQTKFIGRLSDPL